MYRSGRFVADALGDVDDSQVQPNGVDLRLGGIVEPIETGRIGTDGKHVAERRDCEPEDGSYHLDPGGYVVQYADTVRVPEGHIGFVYPRSSLLRNACTIDTAVWDAGYEGRGEGLLDVHQAIVLERGARIAQFVLAEADTADTYDGSYQGERLDQ